MLPGLVLILVPLTYVSQSPGTSWDERAAMAAARSALAIVLALGSVVLTRLGRRFLSPFPGRLSRINPLWLSAILAAGHVLVSALHQYLSCS